MNRSMIVLAAAMAVGRAAGGGVGPVALLGAPAAADRVICGEVAPAGAGPGGAPAFRVTAQQYGFRLADALDVDAESVLTWSWRKSAGKVVVVQIAVTNPETGQRRFLGYGAGAWAEEPAADPTVEVFVADALPAQWTTVKRPVAQDIRTVLGWEAGRITEVYLSPWDGAPGEFAGMTLAGARPGRSSGRDAGRELASLSAIGRGRYSPPRLRRTGEGRELRFDTAFEEMAPGRNSASNEWSAFGVAGGTALNCMGRDLRVRYPAFDLVFRLAGPEGEIAPDSLESFRLGLVNGRHPGVTARWEHGGLRYSAAVLAVPTAPGRAYELYRLEVRNPTALPARSRLTAGLDGPPDMRMERGVVRGLGGVAFVVADAPGSSRVTAREWGLCDKRARSYPCGGGPGSTEPAISSTRVGMDGLPVVYRFRAPAGGPCTVWLAASPHVSRLLGAADAPGDLVLRWEVEGAPAQTVDRAAALRERAGPLCAGFAGARDADGDGFITVTAGCDPRSRNRHSRLSAIYVLPGGFAVDDPARLTSGALNGSCLLHIDVGATPECDWNNQLYDTSDVGACRLDLAYDAEVPAGGSRTWWLRVPPIHRRQPGSMGSVAHAFAEVLPGEAPPAFGPAAVAALRAADPATAWRRASAGWERFFGRMASVRTPDPILADIYRSRIAVRSIHDVQTSPGIWAQACSPWFYYDFAYRDQAYAVYAYDLAGRHDLAERLLRVYCMDVKDVPKGPVAFAETPLQLGMQPDGLWLTRPGQYDAQGQNIWCLTEHYRLTGDRRWLTATAYPYIRRGAMWIVNVRARHRLEVKDPGDPRWGLLPAGAMEVAAVTRGMHHYYMDAWAVLGLDLAAEAAQCAGRLADGALFRREASDMRACLRRSMAATFRRTGLYQGAFWFGVEAEGDGMFGPWGHTPLVWPTRAAAANDPLMEATYAGMERMARQWGGGMYSDAAGSCWPYIGVDQAIGGVLAGRPDRTLDYFCAFTDTAGHTFSWGEGYDNARNVAAGDQPHMWADAQWVSLFRHLIAFEDGDTLLLTPATPRRWQSGSAPLAVRGLPTAFGDLDLTVRGERGGRRVAVTLRIAPRGDQAARRLGRIVLSPRLADGRAVGTVRVNGRAHAGFTRDAVVLPLPSRGATYRVEVTAAD